jgi:hypothetical protein
MTKEQALDAAAKTRGIVNATNAQYVKGFNNGFSDAWTACEAQCPTDAVELKKEITKILTEEITYSGQVQGFIVHGAIEKLMALFNPSGATPQANKICGQDCGCTSAEQCQFNAGNLSMLSRAAPQAAGPVWVKASDHLPEAGKQISFKVTSGGSVYYHGGYVQNGAFKTNHGYGYSYTTLENVEWLDESNTQQVFTREEVVHMITRELSRDYSSSEVDEMLKSATITWGNKWVKSVYGNGVIDAWEIRHTNFLQLVNIDYINTKYPEK